MFSITFSCTASHADDTPLFVGNRKGTQLSTQEVLKSNGGVTVTGPAAGDAVCTIQGGGASGARITQEKGKGFEITVSRGSFTAAGPIVFWVFFGLFILFILIVIIVIVVLAIKTFKK